MGYDVINIEDQTWVFPAAADTTSFSNSIFIPGRFEVIGAFLEALEATSTHLHLQICADGINVLDASCTFADAEDEAGNAITFVMATANKSKIFDVPIRGPVRVRLSAEDAAHAAVDQDEQVVTPLIRQISRT
jgi:hypothetical protein